MKLATYCFYQWKGQCRLPNEYCMTCNAYRPVRLLIKGKPIEEGLLEQEVNNHIDEHLKRIKDGH